MSENRDPVILFVKPQAITSEDKAALREVGVVVVETDDPGAVKMVRAHAELSSSDLLGLACRVIDEHGIKTNDVKHAFGAAVAAAIAAQRT